MAWEAIMSLSDIDDLTDVFEYLDDLRESGVTNMYCAAPYLERDMGLSKRRAGEALSLWLQSFSRNSTPAERAGLCLDRPSAPHT